MTEKDPTICPHCNQKMVLWRPMEEMNWGTEPQWVCFNDDCPYFERGWEHTRKTMRKPASYRYRYIPQTGAVTPLPVWSSEAFREHIVEEE